MLGNIKRLFNEMSRKEHILNYLTCALSTDDHFSKEPIVLSACSHSVCKSCLIKENKTEIKCGRCGVVTSRDLRNDRESIHAKTLINMSLSDLYKVVEQRMSELLVEIKAFQGAVQEKNERVAVLVDYVEEEVGIRVESLKIQLDEIYEKIKSDLRVVRDDLLESECKIDTFEKKLNELRHDISRQKTESEAMFYEYQHYCTKLNEKLREFEKNSYQLEFRPSVAFIDKKSLIGEVNYVNRLNDLNDMHSLRSGLLTIEGLTRSQATFRYTLNELSKFKDSKECIVSPPFMIRNLAWRIELENKYTDDCKEKQSLGFYICCKSDKPLKNKMSICAVVQFRLLHESQQLKENLTYVMDSTEFVVNEAGWGYEKFVEYEALMKLENGFYNVANDSITVEVVVNTEGDAKQVD